MQQLTDNYMSKVYSRSNSLDGSFKNMIKIYDRMYRRYMPDNRNAKILDIACGAGQFLKYCIVNGYSLHMGIDHAPEMVEYVKDNVTTQVLNRDALDYIRPTKDYYDLIVANDFIEHISRDTGIQFVGLVYRSLAPGGRIILKTGNMAAFGGLVILYNGLDHECGYTERSLYSLLAINGFTNIEIIPDDPQKWRGKLLDYGLKLLYKYMYRGNYPRHVCKIIAGCWLISPFPQHKRHYILCFCSARLHKM